MGAARSAVSPTEAMHGRFLFPFAVVLAPLGCKTEPVNASPEPAVMALAPSGTSAPAAATPRLKASPAEASALRKRADACLEDPTCSDDGAALYRAADDAGATDIYCFRFYYAAGMPEDLPRARACFEREVASEPRGCNGSPGLERAYLAAMLIDGQGGAADPKRAEELLGECFRDATVSGLEAEIAKRNPDPWPGARARLDFCTDIGGTTFTMGRCSMMEHDRILLERASIERALLAKLDREAWRLEVKAREAWTSFAVAQAEAYGDGYRGGSIHSLVVMNFQTLLERRRMNALKGFFDYKPNAVIQVAEAEKNLEKAYATACGKDAERRKLCVAARKAFAVYRDAEVALHVHVHGAAYGDRTVALDMKVVTTQGYANDLEDFDKP
jgi:uncharacterized protein YecT (DUF1311 family)